MLPGQKEEARKEEDWPKNSEAKAAKAAEWGDNRLREAEVRWAFKQLWWVPTQDGTFLGGNLEMQEGSFVVKELRGECYMYIARLYRIRIVLHSFQMSYKDSF